MSRPFSMSRFAVDATRGFLPVADPLTQLPPTFTAWEQLAAQIPALLAAGRFRQATNDLPLLDAASLTATAERERAMLLLGYFGHAYVFGEAPVATTIPPVIAVPWHQVAEQLGRPPVLSYASHILNNWRRFDADAPVTLENLARLAHFLGGLDEDWFGMIHIAIEAQAGPGIAALVAAQDDVEREDVSALMSHLGTVAEVVSAMLAIFARITERCDPAIYGLRIRPFLSGWQDNPLMPAGLRYAGVTAYADQPQYFRGGSGAQSAIIPAFDEALGVAFDDNPFGQYMHSLRIYMPPRHRDFITALRQRPSIRTFVRDHRHSERALVDAYNTCLTELARFRREHLRFTAQYLHAPKGAYGHATIEVGTGGTPFMPYLKQHAREVAEHLIP
jgi:indoleamine 2,3-dioxygenase